MHIVAQGSSRGEEQCYHYPAREDAVGFQAGTGGGCVRIALSRFACSFAVQVMRERWRIIQRSSSTELPSTVLSRSTLSKVCRFIIPFSTSLIAFRSFRISSKQDESIEQIEGDTTTSQRSQLDARLVQKDLNHVRCPTNHCFTGSLICSRRSPHLTKSLEDFRRLREEIDRAAEADLVQVPKTRRVRQGVSSVKLSLTFSPGRSSLHDFPPKIKRLCAASLSVVESY